jgi:HK97 gp10 family phage protein
MTAVKFEGGRELEKALSELGNRSTAKRTAERALKRAAVPIRDKWASLVPEDQGDLKRSIKIGNVVKNLRKNLRGDVAAMYVGIDESQNRRIHIYAEVQEFGNESNPAQPAGRPAWESEKHNALNRLADDLWLEIEKTASRAAKKKAKSERLATGTDTRINRRGEKLDANADLLRSRLGG